VVSREKGREDVDYTITEDTAKVVTKKRGFCIDEVVGYVGRHKRHRS